MKLKVRNMHHGISTTQSHVSMVSNEFINLIRTSLKFFDNVLVFFSLPGAPSRASVSCIVLLGWINLYRKPLQSKAHAQRLAAQLGPDFNQP